MSFGAQPPSLHQVILGASFKWVTAAHGRRELFRIRRQAARRRFDLDQESEVAGTVWVARFDPLLDLQKQRDQFALAMRIRLGKDGFQPITRRLPGNLQFAGGGICASSKIAG